MESLDSAVFDAYNRCDLEKFGGYFNIDSGTGRVRGAGVFGPPDAAKIVRDILKPFKDDGVAGATASRSRRAAC